MAIKIQMGLFGPGYFELPDGVELCCPECNAKANKGECEISLGSGGKGGFNLKLRCYKCNLDDLIPIKGG